MTTAAKSNQIKPLPKLLTCHFYLQLGQIHRGWTLLLYICSPELLLSSLSSIPPLLSKFPTGRKSPIQVSIDWRWLSLKILLLKGSTHNLTAAVGTMTELGSNFSEGILNWLFIKTPRTVHEPKMTKRFNAALMRKSLWSVFNDNLYLIWCNDWRYWTCPLVVLAQVLWDNKLEPYERHIQVVFQNSFSFSLV